MSGIGPSSPAASMSIGVETSHDESHHPFRHFRVLPSLMRTVAQPLGTWVLRPVCFVAGVLVTLCLVPLQNQQRVQGRSVSKTLNKFAT